MCALDASTSTRIRTNCPQQRNGTRNRRLYDKPYHTIFSLPSACQVLIQWLGTLHKKTDMQLDCQIQINSISQWCRYKIQLDMQAPNPLSVIAEQKGNPITIMCLRDFAVADSHSSLIYISLPTFSFLGHTFITFPNSSPSSLRLIHNCHILIIAVGSHDVIHLVTARIGDLPRWGAFH